MRIPVWQRLALAPAAAAQRGSNRSELTNERVHRYWQRRSRPAAARSQQQQTVLRGENTVHIRFRQAQALHAHGEDVLQQRL